MNKPDDLQAVRNDRIQFATMRPPGSTMPTRDRRVVVTAPEEAVALAARGDLRVLDQLVALLDDADRAWAAEVLLAAMTGHEADLVNDLQGSPEEFATAIGRGAKARWQTWLDGARPTLAWDATRKQFVTK